MRKKIKAKYLNKSLSDDTGVNQKKRINFGDKIEKVVLKSLISFGLILLMLIWSAIPVISLSLLGVDYTEFSEISKVILMIISDMLFLIILFMIYRKSIIRDFKAFFNRNLKENFKIAVRYWLIGLAIMMVSNYVISVVMDGKMAVNEESVQNLIKIAPWYMAFELIIFAPVSEELIFRRSIRDVVDNRYLYAILSGMIFGGLHAISSFNSMIDLLYFIPYCSLGITFGLLYSKTNNIFSTITVHAIHNGLALLLYFL